MYDISVAMRWLRILDGANSALFLDHARPSPNLIGDEQMREALGGRFPDTQLPCVRGMARAMALGEREKALSRRDRQALGRTFGLHKGDALCSSALRSKCRDRRVDRQAPSRKRNPVDQ